MMIRECARCGQHFKSSHDKKYCDSCLDEIIEKIDHPVTGVCPICGSSFTPRNSRQIYCSSACYKSICFAIERRRERGRRQKKRERPQKIKRKAGLIDKIEAYGRKTGHSYGFIMSRLYWKCKESGRTMEEEFALMEGRSTR